MTGRALATLCAALAFASCADGGREAHVDTVAAATSITLADVADVAAEASASDSRSDPGGSEAWSGHLASCPCMEERPPACTCGAVHDRSDSQLTNALRWLKRHQGDDGHFTASCNVASGCRVASVEATRGTDLATLAFLGNGHSHRFGTFKRTVSAALGALRRSRPTTADTEAVAAYTWAKALAVSRDAQLASDLRQAIAPVWSRAMRGEVGEHPAWDRLALLESRTALTDLPLPPESWTWGPLPARDGGLNVLAMSPLDVATCAASVRLWADPSLDASWLVDGLPATVAGARGVANPAAWFWGALALRGRDAATLRAWFRALDGTILPAQRSGHCVCGSWDPPPGWTRVEATAMCVLALEEGLAWRYARER